MNVESSPNIWFQQDSTNLHTYLPALEWLRIHFGDKIIEHRSEFSWQIT